jgi:hypothetical protein
MNTLTRSLEQSSPASFRREIGSRPETFKTLENPRTGYDLPPIIKALAERRQSIELKAPSASVAFKGDLKANCLPSTSVTSCALNSFVTSLIVRSTYVLPIRAGYAMKYEYSIRLFYRSLNSSKSNENGDLTRERATAASFWVLELGISLVIGHWSLQMPDWGHSMTTPKILGQVSPAATTLAALYTPPGCCRATIDTLTICNRSAVATTFRISVAPKGAVDAVAHYLYYDTAIAGNATINLTQLDMRLTETDELRVYAAAATLSFGAFGIETL